MFEFLNVKNEKGGYGYSRDISTGTEIQAKLFPASSKKKFHPKKNTLIHNRLIFFMQEKMFKSGN